MSRNQDSFCVKCPALMVKWGAGKGTKGTSLTTWDPYHLGCVWSASISPTSKKNTPSPPINVEPEPLLLGQRKAKLPAMLCSIQHQSILARSNGLPVKVFFFEDRHTPGNATILRKPCFEPNCVWGHSTLSVRRLLEGADPRTPKGQNSQTAG